MPSSTSHFERYIPAVLFGLALAFAVYRFATVAFGYPVKGMPNEPWTSDVIRLRSVLFTHTYDPAKKTIWVVGGSSVLFGIASDVLAQRTGYNVRNHGLHVAVAFDVAFAKAVQESKPGDIVLAPVEWGFADRTRISQWMYSNYLYHFWSSVRIDTQTRYQILSAVPLKHWIAAFESVSLRQTR